MNGAPRLTSCREIGYHCIRKEQRVLKSGNHVTIIDPMRGVAALAVVIFHYLGSVLPTLRPNGVEHIVEYGKLGVQVFFVISGFVIPYAMQRSGYTWAGWWRFMLRRIVRIAPPAYVAALAMIGFHLLSMAVNGRPVDGDPFPGFGFAAVFGNLTFTAEYLGAHWYNFVYWSLTAEFEFYLILALVMPLIARGSPNWRVATLMLALLASNFIAGPKFFAYVHYFVLGMLVFLWRETVTDKRILLAIGALTCSLGIAAGEHTAIGVSVVAALIIASGTGARTRATDLLGDISYSLYIMHVPVAVFAESIVKRLLPIHDTLMGKSILFMAYLCLALVVSYAFHRLVERPFVKWSKAIPQRRNTAVA